MSDPLRSVRDSRVSKSTEARGVRRLLQAEKIERLGVQMPFPCSNCARSSSRCMVSDDGVKCGECTRRGRQECDIGMSEAQWRRLQVAREKVEKELALARDAEIEARVRTRRLERQFASLDSRQREMMAKESMLLDKLDELDRVEAERDAAPVAEASSSVGKNVSVVVASSSHTPSERFPSVMSEGGPESSWDPLLGSPPMAFADIGTSRS